MLELASYMKGDTCATKEGEGRNAPMSLSSSLHESTKKERKRVEKKNKPSTSIASFRVRAGFDCQSEACVCICTKVLC